MTTPTWNTLSIDTTLSNAASASRDRLDGWACIGTRGALKLSRSPMPDGHFSKRSKAAQTLQPRRR